MPKTDQVRKSSIICSICGEDNDPNAIYCFECGTSLKSTESNKSIDFEESNRSQDTRLRSDTSDSAFRPRHRSSNQGMMMWGINSRFLMMAIVLILIVIIFAFFSNVGEMPSRN